MARSEQIKQELRKRAAIWRPTKFLSTGSTTLNLACSGRTDGGIPAGSYTLFVGDSDSGKTFFGLSILAEASIDPFFDDYELVYDCPEGGTALNIKRYFGPKLAERIRPPRRSPDGEPLFSDTVEDFYYNIDDLFKTGKPFVLVLDSQDCLGCKREDDKFQKNKRISRRVRGEDKEGDDKVTGDYADGKAKVHSANLRRVRRMLQKTGSILVILNQTRDSFSMFEPDGNFSGGRALKFYALIQLWSKVAGQIKRRVLKKDRQLGVMSQIKVKKNHITGKTRSVVVPIFHSSGIDDVGSCIAYLLDEGIWEEKNKVITATGLGPAVEMKMEALVQHIQEKELEEDLRELVGSTWAEVEESCRVERRNRYA